MNFLDNSGHIFSLPSYVEEPIGYEYDEQWCLGMIGTVHEDAIRMTVARYGEKGCREIFIQRIGIDFLAFDI